jgi:hypothetical protein
VPNNAAFRSALGVGLGTGVAVAATGGGVTGATVAGEGVAVLEHAANTRTAVDSNPTNRFDIKVLPMGLFPDATRPLLP